MHVLKMISVFFYFDYDQLQVPWIVCMKQSRWSLFQGSENFQRQEFNEKQPLSPPAMFQYNVTRNSQEMLTRKFLREWALVRWEKIC